MGNPKPTDLATVQPDPAERDHEEIWKARVQRAKRIASNPSVSYATILALVGVIIAMWLHEPSQRSQVLFRTVTGKQLVFNEAVSGPGFQVIDAAGELINENVYLSRVTFWNQGTSAVDSSEYRSQPGIYVARPGSRVEVRVVDQLDRSVDGFRVSMDSVRLRSDGSFAIAAHLSWDRFDPGSYVTVQALYSGGDSTSIFIAGDTKVGAFEPAPRAPIFEFADLESRWGSVLFLAILAAPLLLFAVVAAGFLKLGASVMLGVVMPPLNRHIARGKWQERFGAIGFILFVLAWLAAMIWIMTLTVPTYEWLFREPPVPPFDQ